MYKGSSGPLLARKRHAGDYHGKDGLGDAPDPDAPGLELLQKEDARQALIEMVKNNAGEVRKKTKTRTYIFFLRERNGPLKYVCVQVTLVATAPLTNLAVAVQLDPSLPKKLKALYIMGGNTDCKFPPHQKTKQKQKKHLSSNP